MSSAAITIVAFLLFTFVYILFNLVSHPKQNTITHKKPPGPSTLPIIGNLHILGTLPHRTLQSLSKKYGPIMSLQLGQVPVIIISSSKAAESFLKTHDIVFASRPKIQGSDLLSYGSKGVVFSAYGHYWRSMRKICILKLLSPSKVEMFGPIRKEELGVLVKSLEKAALVGEVVNVSESIEILIQDIVYKMILGRSNCEQFDLKRLFQKGMTLVGSFNLADYIPWLGAFDLQGIRRACKEISKALDEVLEVIITEHEQITNKDKIQHEDFVDILLSVMHQSIDPENEESHLVIAQLVHCFNWELPYNITPSNLNMEEKFGLSIPRAQHLLAIPSYRLASDAKHE
ncbi:hypothetical protein P8452_43702 [Trifolium repens]|nr:hypothetical protein P8452_43702 [Trifolium repens]